MQTLEALKQTIHSTSELHAVVRTMKTLAAVNMRQYARAGEAVGQYSLTVEQGLAMLFRVRPHLGGTARPGGSGVPGFIAFGTDQGMCGQLNEEIHGAARRLLSRPAVRVAAMGERLAGVFQAEGQDVERILGVPGSVAYVARLVAELLDLIRNWTEEGIGSITLINTRPAAGALGTVEITQLLPIDLPALRTSLEREDSRRCLPLFTLDDEELLAGLLEQYLSVTLYRAAAESMVSENSARLAAMQGAERNIEDRLVELTDLYNQRRQSGITEELMDIVSGFEALSRELFVSDEQGG
ncbi:F0F1 ATP synthase subunit gamma [Salidesulfovibrio onnuriiensis]|uniref:F0F1 ATP synthase subunit gamma n=1 Tax=Salidesulfovibrio onnuriiensis TaxID=2583823 RepID=UPI0011C92C25|nr:F0F1 ATP synthase subunit gamma [Salidesulfovibrio onnuriiensis]